MNVVSRGDALFKRIARSKIAVLNTYVESLVLAGFKPDDPTIKNILEGLGEDDALDIVIVSTMTPTEYQTEVIDKFKTCKFELVEGQRSLVLTTPSATVKARVRLAHLLCMESVNPTVSSTSELARVSQRLTSLQQQPPQAPKVETPTPYSTTVRKLN